MASPAVTEPPGIDVEMDVLVRVLGLQKQKLGDDQVGHVILDRAHQENHALLQEPE
jgi:hypothetical protein